MNKYVTYLRVSTQKQGATGLGLDAQRKMCSDFISSNKGNHVQEFFDVESGTHRDRRGLWQAIEYCKSHKCSLVIAKLDRLARDVEFTFKVINTGIDIHFTDMPVVNSMILGVFASVAQYEREMCSSRTKAALAVKKTNGVRLGAANEKYIENYKKLSAEERYIRNMKKGVLKRLRHQESPEFQAFLKILKKVFPDSTKNENFREWDWCSINCKSANREQILRLMQNYKEFDTTHRLFVKFDFVNDMGGCEKKIHQYMQGIKRSISGTIKEESQCL